VDLLEEGSEVERFGADRERLTAVETGDGEKIGQEPLHPIGSALDDAEDLRALVLGLLAPVEERSADRDDVEGVAEVVRDDGQDLVGDRAGPEPHGTHGKRVLLFAHGILPRPIPHGSAG
jgi:hypothetical protein